MSGSGDYEVSEFYIRIYCSSQDTVFEGDAHPYKPNLVQFHGQEVKSILDVLPKESKKKWTEEIVI